MTNWEYIALVTSYEIHEKKHTAPEGWEPISLTTDKFGRFYVLFRRPV